MFKRFDSTNEALEYGKSIRGDNFAKKELEIRKDKKHIQYKILSCLMDYKEAIVDGERKYISELLIELATDEQLYREALEVAEKENVKLENFQVGTIDDV